MGSERESTLGISEYAAPGPRIEALFKARYSDFQVNEIPPSGRVAELKNLEPPVEPKLAPLGEAAPPPRPLAPADWERIRALADARASGERPPVRVDAARMDKEARKSVHDAVKRAFGGRVVGSTVTVADSDERLLEFVARGTEGGKRTDARRRWEWSGDFVHFVLYKENRDTMEAAGAIADRLRFKSVDPAYFGYCGTKDKRAKTSQWFSIKKVEPKRISDACRGLRDVAVGDFTFCQRHLKLGDLRGNRFRIALRNLKAEQTVVEESLENLKKYGFVNYFGLQRFGSRVDVPTYVVGRHILKENYEKVTYHVAVNSILEPHGKSFDALQRYRESGDAAAALADFRGARSSPEAKLLMALSNGDRRKDGQDPYARALNALPRNMRLLYVHSYQSWVWNRCVSERLKRFGLECHPGDLVPIDPIRAIAEETEAEDEEAKDAPRVRALTEEDIASGKYTMFDVVMPLPGFNVQYPSNIVDFYETALSEDGLKTDLKHKNKAYSLGGAYRRILVIPENLSWNFVKYSDPFADLIESDLDALNKKPIIADCQIEGKYAALLLKFDLPSSTYATMVLRELLKIDTCSEVQALSNDYHTHEAVKRKDVNEEECELTNKKNKTSD